LLGLGIIGEYIAKTYLETKRRPRFIVERTAPTPEAASQRSGLPAEMQVGLIEDPAEPAKMASLESEL